MKIAKPTAQTTAGQNRRTFPPHLRLPISLHLLSIGLTRTSVETPRKPTWFATFRAKRILSRLLIPQ
jgi:hypothetical protein